MNKETPVASGESEKNMLIEELLQSIPLLIYPAAEARAMLHWLPIRVTGSNRLLLSEENSGRAAIKSPRAPL